MILWKDSLEDSKNESGSVNHGLTEISTRLSTPGKSIQKQNREGTNLDKQASNLLIIHSREIKLDQKIYLSCLSFFVGIELS